MRDLKNIRSGFFFERLKFKHLKFFYVRIQEHLLALSSSINKCLTE